jgi:predicted hydrocarbon binding protein
MTIREINLHAKNTSKILKSLPASYCLCSAGWVQEMFETVTGRPVHVELIRSIKGGAPDCRFVVRL